MNTPTRLLKRAWGRLVWSALRTLVRTIYRIRVVGAGNRPVAGPALLVCNHVTYVDQLIVGAVLRRYIRFLMYGPYFRKPGVSRVLGAMHVIPVCEADGRGILRSLDRARQALRAGHVVCIFAEGSITRTGNLLPFKRGLERILEGVDAPVIPVHLDGLWGSVFSNAGGRFFWKWPRRLPYRVTVSFGSPMPASSKAQDVRAAVMELGADAADHRRGDSEFLHLEFIRQAKRTPFAPAMADSTGASLSYWRTLATGLGLARALERRCPGESTVGLLFPASVGGALANVAVAMANRVSVNLNFTAGPAAMASAVRQCGIRTILTSRRFLEGARLQPMEGMVFVEDLAKDIVWAERLAAAAAALLVPGWVLCRRLRPADRTPFDLATVLFSSGSTGEPKGVMLSHHNVLSNVESIRQMFGTDRRDVLLGVLPFFHAFGYTGSIWFPVTTGFRAFYHPNPGDAETIGRLALRERATILISTPTFYGRYLRQCPPEAFASLRYAVVGAERLRPAVAEAFQDRFGVGLLEGYGCTEMSPVVAGNVPDFMSNAIRQRGCKPGTVGRPAPNVAVRIVDAQTGEILPAGREGLLLVRGPNRMIGYLGRPEETARSLRGGWYVTGDLGALDEEGFLAIRDRVSRFSKIAGEMVPHGAIEDAALEHLGGAACAVTGVPDESRGEKIVLLYADGSVEPGDLHRRLTSSALPKLWLPKPWNILRVAEIPRLGTGKVDLAKLKALAAAAVGTGPATGTEQYA